MKEIAQIIAITVSILLALFGCTFALIGAIREVKPGNPGKGLVQIVVGTIALGLSGIVISIAGKLLE